MANQEKREELWRVINLNLDPCPLMCYREGGRALELYQGVEEDSRCLRVRLESRLVYLKQNIQSVCLSPSICQGSENRCVTNNEGHRDLDTKIHYKGCLLLKALARTFYISFGDRSNFFQT